MPSRSRSVEIGRCRGADSVREISREIDDARRQRGLSLAVLGSAAGLSRWRAGRICRGADPSLTIAEAAVMLGAVGLELSIRAYPRGEPVRDAAHLALLERFRRLIHRDLRWRSEVPIGGAGGLRAWDATIAGHGWVIGVEAETRIRDVQALVRGLSLKTRDGEMEAVVLLLADTRHHRGVIRLAAPLLRDSFPVAGRVAIERLASGEHPGGSAIVWA